MTKSNNWIFIRNDRIIFCFVNLEFYLIVFSFMKLRKRYSICISRKSSRSYLTLCLVFAASVTGLHPLAPLGWPACWWRALHTPSNLPAWPTLIRGLCSSQRNLTCMRQADSLKHWIRVHPTSDMLAQLWANVCLASAVSLKVTTAPPPNHLICPLATSGVAAFVHRHLSRILVQVTIYRRLLIGRDGHLDHSEAYDIS